jgi:hypothetical protein
VNIVSEVSGLRPRPEGFVSYWVVATLLLTVLATVVLLQHTQPIDVLAVAAAKGTLGLPDLQGVRVQMVVDAGAAPVMLLVTTTLGVYKPRGTTRHGWRKQQEARAALLLGTASARERRRHHDGVSVTKGATLDRTQPAGQISILAAQRVDLLLLRR